MPAQTNHKKRDPQHEAFIAQLNVPFDVSSPAHVQQLEQLWRLAWPHVEYEGLKADRWCEMGFQRSEPVSDLRGAGLAGVANLCYFLEHRHAEFEEFVASGEIHCFAVSSLAITLLLRGYLGLHDYGQRLMPVAPGEEARATAAVRRRFVAWIAVDRTAFMQLHAVFLSALQRTWMEARQAGWNLLDFPVLLAATRNHIAQTLPRAITPLSLAHIEMAAARNEPTLTMQPPPHACMGLAGKGSSNLHPPSRRTCSLLFCKLPDRQPCESPRANSFRPNTARFASKAHPKHSTPAPDSERVKVEIEAMPPPQPPQTQL
ncbi:hypothetical protein AB1Y20_005396 [Prymnesium parvum]|uniref:ELMO domain-containing protein n=1 Tax=Prymnesium parvum TaxID=97485 RepID=A0AB34J386_PRYPA